MSYGELDAFMPELEELSWNLDEPFDHHMTLLRVVYLAARRKGLKVLLDGAGGDTVLAEGSHLARLLRGGHWLTAYREALGQERFWGGAFPAWRELYLSARAVIVPDSVRRLRQRQTRSRRVEQCILDSMINPSFARRVSLAGRLQTLNGHGTSGLLPQYGMERAKSIDHPYLTVGRERYDRVAAAAAVEPRDPFLDLRVVALCVALPGAQKLGGGWPKAVLRRAMAGQMPDAVRWRRGKEHLGFAFTTALMQKAPGRIQAHIEANSDALAPYVDPKALGRACGQNVGDGDCMEANAVYDIAHLGAWLRCSERRPRAIM
jgi:asparagine synthase (glutamine-hydrolysing)